MAGSKLFPDPCNLSLIEELLASEKQLKVRDSEFPAMDRVQNMACFLRALYD